MGQSTDGQICYGIKFEEGFHFAWDDATWKGDIKDWWRYVNEYKPPFELHDYRTITEIQEQEYYNIQGAWDDAHPIPIELVNYCHIDRPMYILALKETFKYYCSRGYPVEFNPTELKTKNSQKLLDFCEKYLKDEIEKFNSCEYNEPVELTPKWYLSSYWG